MFPRKFSKAALILVVFLQVSGGYANSLLNGKYIYDTNPNDKSVHKVLLEYGFEVADLDVIHRFASETTKEIVVDGDRVKITHVTPKGKYPQEFVHGKEVDEPYLLDKPEYVAKTTATIEADKNKITFKRKLSRKSKEEMIDELECHEDGCRSTLTAGKEKVTIKWKRLS